MGRNKLVIFGVSNMLSDIFDCAIANGLILAKVVIHHPEQVGDRDISLADRLTSLSRICKPPVVEKISEFEPHADEVYILGPTNPARRELAQLLYDRFKLGFCTLVHPTAYVSPLATLSQGVFVGANSAIAPGVQLGSHVFINRGVTVGHDTRIGDFSRVQPGSHTGGLSKIGTGVTVGLGATIIERLRIGDNAVIGAGAVVLEDVPANVLVAGVPAKIKKSLA